MAKSSSSSSSSADPRIREIEDEEENEDEGETLSAIRDGVFFTAFVFIRVHSWLKGKAQHFDGGGDFDVLVADDKI